MKIARARLSDGDVVVGLIADGKFSELMGVGPSDLVAFAMTRDPSAAKVGRVIPITDVRFLSPIERPPSIRDFSAFEMHTKNCVEGTGGKMNPLWYELPVFYYSNPSCVIGDQDVVIPPRRAKSIDYELEVACVVGQPLRDLDKSDPNWHTSIAGFLLMNDWSARDIGSQELKLFMGPAKAKDFATSLGPWLVTPDELSIQGGRVDLPLTARVNGKVLSEGNLADMHFDWPTILGRASEDVTLYPGDVIGSGTCGSGCLIELRITGGRDNHPWLKAGDTIEIEAPHLGTLTNSIAA
jgi:fumarylacetoacetate (FAA) hydrolase